MTTLQIDSNNKGYAIDTTISLKTIVNDENVRHMGADMRQCKFPDEQTNSSFKFYSYTTCVTDCIKAVQIRTCNCAYHFIIFDSTVLFLIIYMYFICINYDNFFFFFKKMTEVQFVILMESIV